MSPQGAAAISCAIIVYRAMGGVSIGSRASLSLVPFAVAFLTALLVNTLAVSGVLAISLRERFLRTWKQTTQGVIVYDLFAIPVVYGFAYVYHYSPAWALGIMFPIFGLRQLYKTNWQLETINQELLQLMVAAIEARDPYTSGHSQRVAEYSRIVSRAAGLRSKEIERVYTAALLHDVGKIHEEFAIILRKPGRLTEAEYGIMQGHSEKGAVLVGKVTQFRDLVPAIRGHHEAWDGTGYPDERKEEDIPLWARIIAFADTIDAMTTDRPYREALGADAVRAEIVAQAGRQFDPRIAVELVAERHWSIMAEAIRARRTTTRRMTPRSMDAIPRHSGTRARVAAV